MLNRQASQKRRQRCAAASVQVFPEKLELGIEFEIIFAAIVTDRIVDLELPIVFVKFHLTARTALGLHRASSLTRSASVTGRSARAGAATTRVQRTDATMVRCIKASVISR
jgi:hypothetical protein